MEIQGQEVLSLWDALCRSTHLSIRWHHHKILRPTRDFQQTHLQEPEFFLVHKWQVSEETRLVKSRLLREISTRGSTSKSGTGKDYSSGYLRRSPAKSTFKRLCKQTPLWRFVMSKTPQEPQRSRRPQERDVQWSAPFHARHTHCATRQLGTTADRRYNIPRDWLREACQMARVHCETRCTGFCCKECPNYRIEQSARNQWNAIKCKEPLGSHSEAVIRQATISLYSQVWKSLGDSLPELFCANLAEAYVTRESVSLRTLCEKKSMIRDQPTDVCMRNLQQKAEWGNNTCTNPCTRFPRASCFKKTCNVCQKYGGTYTTWYLENQRYKKTGQEIGFLRSQERRKETSK